MTYFSPVPNSEQKRFNALDALRGFAILTMVLSGVIPYGVLPSWMYHAQIPPPTHKFNPALPGLTWVDLVFPLFLFAMGASIPLALSRRIDKGISYRNIVTGILERGFLLGFFAIYLRHVRPHVMNPQPTAVNWLVAILGFTLMFPIFTRLPVSWSHVSRWLVKAAGWLGAILLLMFLRYPDGSGFSLYRSDIIIIVLTNMAIFASLLWLVTREKILLRLGILGILIGVRLANPEPGWVHWLWQLTPVPWLYKLYYLQYLFILVPGTIVGDLVTSWQKKPVEPTVELKNWPPACYSAIAVVMVALIVVLIVGLQARWLWQTTLISLMLCGLGWWLVKKPNNETEQLVKTILTWGIYWLFLGLVFEAYEGGIKKDHPTLAYYFVTTGQAIFLLIAFTIVIDILRKKHWLQLLIDNGKNPMIAYVGHANFIWPILALTHLEKWILTITPTPWSGFCRGVGYTLILAFMVSLITRKKIFWRT